MSVANMNWNTMGIWNNDGIETNLRFLERHSKANAKSK